MWHFISWIEIDNEPNILFLTDREVYDDPEGRDVLRPYRHDDILGHDAIRSYYRLPRGHGEERKERYFWKADLPAVIAEKVANVETFNRHWGRMWRSDVFQYRDLKFMVEYAPEPFKEQAAALLLEQYLDNYRLRFLAALAPEPYATEARRRIGW